jgi:CRP-like cAMP-binding protein
MSDRRSSMFGWLPGRQVGQGTSSASSRVQHMQRKREYLHKQDLFRELTAEEIEKVDRQTQIVTCPEGCVLYSQDDRAEALFLLKRGRVQTYRLAPQGKRLELGDMIGALRESVTKVLDEFQAQGLVKLARGRINLLDVAGLRARLQE